MEKYFKEILPEYDAERVYHSDIKKIFQWYNLLQSKQLLEFVLFMHLYNLISRYSKLSE